MAGVRISGGRAALVIVVALAAAVAALWIAFRPAGVPLAVVGQTIETPLPPPPPPPPPWTARQLSDLLGAIGRADANGLRAADYHPDALRAAIDAGSTGPQTDTLANAAAQAIAHDYAAGRIRNRHRFNWYIDYAGPDAAELKRQILAARADGHLESWLTGLLPDDADYRALRDALADTPDDEQRRDRIKANLERRRWLPRTFADADDRLYVNLPTYRLDVRRSGETTASYRAVIGATDMPTPVLSASVRQIIVNPDWIVPASIVRKSHLKPSSRYIFSRRPDGTLRVRQKPGAGNALGKVKIEFPNKLAIYFHDTPSRSLFGRDVRTFSHGCVRIQDIAALAGSIVRDSGRYDTAMAGTQTRSLPPSGAWRADIVYFTLVRGADGGLEYVGDPYRMDEAMAAALEGRKPRVPPIVPATVPSTGSAASPIAPVVPRIDLDDSVIEAPTPVIEVPETPR